jgi:ElaB/YqjD/DUF883 family membrane-anchored ribosome-binding protein
MPPCPGAIRSLFNNDFTMTNTTSASNPANPSSDAESATPFPDSNSTANAAGAAPVVDGLIKRVTQSAHDAVDNVAAKVTAVTDNLQGGVDKVGDTRDEWIEAARDAIRQHPFAAVAGAVLIGAALISLRSSRQD